MKWCNSWIAAIRRGLRMLRTGSASDDTEVIDGGTRHYVDTNAPKTIASTRIRSFHCEFSTTDLMMNDSPIAGRYYTLRAAQTQASYEARGGGEVFGKREFQPDAAFWEALQQLVSRNGLARYNGQFYTVAGLPPDHGSRLNIQYDSGECIRASDNQSSFLTLEAMTELVMLFCPMDSPKTKEE